jgi:hypothetical protein
MKATGFEREGFDAFGRDGSQPFTFAYSSKLDTFASPCLDPEAALLEKEQCEQDGVEDIEPKRRLILSRAKLHEYLGRLPEHERDAVVSYFAAGQNQYQLAARFGVSQPGMRDRILRGLQRLRWMSGPGAAFTSDELEAYLEGSLPPDEVRALAIYWRTTSQAEICREMRIEDQNRVWKLVHSALSKLTGKYKRGFDALRSKGHGVLAPAAVPYSALSAFLIYRCVFEREARVPRAALLASYERFARSHGRPVSVPRLLEELRRRAVRPAVVWAAGPARNVSGYAGVGFAASKLAQREKAA